ncbi:MAG: hypothetical protein C6W57_16865 [Caldibacillus debilis]|nr:MAG: hypothetical protein C6W57_16865 [Caldibacillus debilis]
MFSRDIPFDPLTNDFVTLQFFFAQWNSLLSHTDIFTEALQYDNITDEQHIFFAALRKWKSNAIMGGNFKRKIKYEGADRGAGLQE